MQAVGVICEYNPFHRGHALHLSRARALSKADYVVCVMSGSVTQRGAFARHDKWTRARDALSNGADLVIELPVRFACSSAMEFAQGGVDHLAALGVVTHLSFGCESDALPLLPAALAAFDEANPIFADTLHTRLDEGLPYPRARALAAQAASGIDNLSELIAKPNAALALEYLRALPKGIIPVPVVREGAGYHDSTLGELSSASAIRIALAQGQLEAVRKALPENSSVFGKELWKNVHGEEALSQALLYRLRTISPAELEAISGMDEGLENRFIAAARKENSRGGLIGSIKTKRYTHARLSRAATCALLGITKEFARENNRPAYARILGFRKDATPLMKAIKERASVPLITKAADFDPAQPLFALDLRAQDLWNLGSSGVFDHVAGQDFKTSPIIL